MDKYIKISLAILFFICLQSMAYGYYQLVRLIALAGFAILAYMSNDQGRETETIIYVCLGLLFRRFIKIALGRQFWNIIDVVVGIG